MTGGGRPSPPPHEERTMHQNSPANITMHLFYGAAGAPYIRGGGAVTSKKRPLLCIHYTLKSFRLLPSFTVLLLQWSFAILSISLPRIWRNKIISSSHIPPSSIVKMTLYTAANQFMPQLCTIEMLLIFSYLLSKPQVDAAQILQNLPYTVSKN